MPAENLGLSGQRGAPQLINATLPYRYDLGRGGVGLELSPHLGSYALRIPRMYAHGIIKSPRAVVAGREIDNGPRLAGSVGVEISDVAAHESGQLGGGLAAHNGSESRHGVIAAATPGMTPANASQGKPKPLEWAMLAQGFEGILTA